MNETTAEIVGGLDETIRDRVLAGGGDPNKVSLELADSAYWENVPVDTLVRNELRRQGVETEEGEE
jgi:hypothetical protein